MAVFGAARTNDRRARRGSASARGCSLGRMGHERNYTRPAPRTPGGSPVSRAGGQPRPGGAVDPPARYFLARRSSSRPNACSAACVMRGWKTATTASVASGRSRSSASSTAGHSGSGWPAAVERLPDPLEEQLRRTRARRVGVSRGRARRRRARLERDRRARASSSPARSSVGLGDLEAALAERHDEPELLGASQRLRVALGPPKRSASSSASITSGRSSSNGVRIARREVERILGGAARPLDEVA